MEFQPNPSTLREGDCLLVLNKCKTEVDHLSLHVVLADHENTDFRSAVGSFSHLTADYAEKHNEINLLAQ